MKIHFIVHESFESPGAFEDWVKLKKHNSTYTHLYAGEKLPDNSDNFDFFIILGGPQSPDTSIVECPHFDARKEILLIKDSIHSGKLVLGICLGAQLIGEALGAKFSHSPNKEIGIFNIMLTDEARYDPIFANFPKKFLVGHWHGDMPGLTPEAKILATSEGCPRQIVRYAQGVYGFQCHFEFTQVCIKNMIKHCAHELKDADTLPYIQNTNVLQASDFSNMNTLLFSFLDSMQEIYELKGQKSCTIAF